MRLQSLCILTVLLLPSCATQIKNVRWYGDLGPRGAVYFETLTDESGQIDKPTWDQMRIGMACTSSDSVAAIKDELEKLCSKAPCSYETLALLNKVESNLGAVKEATQ